MPLPWPEIRDKAIAFSREWQDAESERAEAQTFWNEFFAVFGVPRRRVATFEEPVKKLGAKRGRIDAFWKGQLVVEHKSRGEDLDRAFEQALDYFPIGIFPSTSWSPTSRNSVCTTSIPAHIPNSR